MLDYLCDNGICLNMIIDENHIVDSLDLNIDYIILLLKGFMLPAGK